jgi:hypothetical protein
VCAYCRGEGISTAGEHVISRQFFLEQDRRNLPKVPSCDRCNTLKSDLEKYALTVLPLGSRHPDAKVYSDANLRRRLDHNKSINQRLALEPIDRWEQQASGLLLPVSSIEIEQQKITSLFEYIVRGLFVYHWHEVLNMKWFPHVAVIKPDAEALVFTRVIQKMGTPLHTLQGNLGRSTLTYWGIRGSTSRWFSAWQFTLFGGLQFGNAALPGDSFTRLSAVTRPDMSQVPFTDEEAGTSELPQPKVHV